MVATEIWQEKIQIGKGEIVDRDLVVDQKQLPRRVRIPLGVYKKEN